MYGLSEKGEDTFPKEYKQFAIDMLEDLARMGDEKILRYVLKERTKRMEEQLQKRVSNQKNLAYKVQEIAAMQEKNGYMVQIKRDGENSFVIEKQNCPLKEIAERFPQVCEDEKEMYNRLFAGADVKTLANMCEGDCSCSYQVKEKK